MIDESLEVFKWDVGDNQDNKDYPESLKSPEEILSEAFGELDHLNAAMFHLAPGNNIKRFMKMKTILLQLPDTLPSVTVECLCQHWRSQHHLSTVPVMLEMIWLMETKNLMKLLTGSSGVLNLKRVCQVFVIKPTESERS